MRTVGGQPYSVGHRGCNSSDGNAQRSERRAVNGDDDIGLARSDVPGQLKVDLALADKQERSGNPPTAAETPPSETGSGMVEACATDTVQPTPKTDANDPGAIGCLVAKEAPLRAAETDENWWCLAECVTLRIIWHSSVNIIVSDWEG